MKAGRKCGSIKKNRHAVLDEVIEHATQEVGQNIISFTYATNGKGKKLKMIIKKMLEKLNSILLENFN